ncbi:hypothetical protein N9061_00135 [bacterium]|nr:hypothetical protein [bacterium]
MVDLPPHDPGQLRDDLSIHSLLCSAHVEMMICSQRSLYMFSDLGNVPLLLHDDGSLTPADINLINTKLPNARIISRSEANKKALDLLPNFPEIHKYRKNQIMALKLVDVGLWAKGSRTLYIDSDILFFSPPHELIDAVKPDARKNLFNKDIFDSYVAPRQQIEEALGYGPKQSVNAGLWAMNTSVIDFDKIERWLKEPVFNLRPHYYTLDQTFISMLANISEDGCDYFPAEYDVSFEKSSADCCVKHYVGAIRHGFELEGLEQLMQSFKDTLVK